LPGWNTLLITSKGEYWPQSFKSTTAATCSDDTTDHVQSGAGTFPPEISKTETEIPKPDGAEQKNQPLEAEPVQTGNELQNDDSSLQKTVSAGAQEPEVAARIKTETVKPEVEESQPEMGQITGRQEIGKSVDSIVSIESDPGKPAESDGDRKKIRSKKSVSSGSDGSHDLVRVEGQGGDVFREINKELHSIQKSR